MVVFYLALFLYGTNYPQNRFLNAIIQRFQAKSYNIILCTVIILQMYTHKWVIIQGKEVHPF